MAHEGGRNAPVSHLLLCVGLFLDTAENVRQRVCCCRIAGTDEPGVNIRGGASLCVAPASADTGPELAMARRYGHRVSARHTAVRQGYSALADLSVIALRELCRLKCIFDISVISFCNFF